MSLLRWELPNSGLAYDPVDGSVRLEDVSRHVKASASALATACSPLVGGKQRFLIFEKKNASHLERRIAAIGGHGFQVFSPPGSWLISGAKLIGKIVHLTDKGIEIKNQVF